MQFESGLGLVADQPLKKIKNNLYTKKGETVESYKICFKNRKKCGTQNKNKTISIGNNKYG